MLRKLLLWFKRVKEPTYPRQLCGPCSDRDPKVVSIPYPFGACVQGPCARCGMTNLLLRYER